MRRISSNGVVEVDGMASLFRKRSQPGGAPGWKRGVPAVPRLFARFVFWGLSLGGLLLSLPRYRAYGWGPAAHRLVNTSAVATLPPPLRAFFEANRSFLTEHANDPDEWIKKDPYERTHQYIYLDKYGLFPYLGLPYSYKLAVSKYGGRRVSANGTLPWRIGEYSLRLTNNLQAQKWDDAKLDAVVLAHFVSDAHDPLHTTQNFDGQLTDQTGLSVRFGSSLIDRYANFLMLHPQEASKIDDPTTYAFHMAVEANTWVDRILWADWSARAGLSDYTDEYFDRFYTLLGSTAAQEISAAAHDAGSYWYTAWLNAGQPSLPAR
jgi:hypothetical protein